MEISQTQYLFNLKNAYSYWNQNILSQASGIKWKIGLGLESLRVYLACVSCRFNTCKNIVLYREVRGDSEPIPGIRKSLLKMWCFTGLAVCMLIYAPMYTPLVIWSDANCHPHGTVE